MSRHRQKRLAGPAFYVNVRLDGHHLLKRPRGNLPNEVYDIKEAELLVANVERTGPQHHRKIPLVYSSTNNIDDDLNVQFIGVAQTEFKYDDRDPRWDQGLVACTHGVITILNESGSIISPGERLYLTHSTEICQRGIPSAKKRFTVTKDRQASIIDGSIGIAVSHAKHGDTLDALIYPRRDLDASEY